MECSMSAVWVIVLGDFGRSPRMQYHALSLLARGYSVVVFAYHGSADGMRPELHRASQQGKLTMRGLPEMSRALRALPRSLRWAIKLIVQAIALLVAALCTVAATFTFPAFILVQSPPAIPSLPVALVLQAALFCPVAVDLHNVAYTLMRPLQPAEGKMKVTRRDATPVRIAAFIEKWAAPRCRAAVTVSHEYAAHMRDHWQLHAQVLHDIAPSFFTPVQADEAHALLLRLRDELTGFVHKGGGFLEDHFTDGLTPCTQQQGGCVDWRTGLRPMFVVSSTSWTADEDFQVLLDAILKYDHAVSVSTCLPPLVVLVTGKGANKAHYLEKLEACTLHHVVCATAWLRTEDYVRVLAVADVGVSLHASSSGLDLPMKVADMLGCGTPVCAFNYGRVVGEQVQGRKNGLLFSDAEELSECWKTLFSRSNGSGSGDRRRSGPSGEKAVCFRGYNQVLAKMASELSGPRKKWQDEWDAVMLRLIDNMQTKGKDRERWGCFAV